MKFILSVLILVAVAFAQADAPAAPAQSIPVDQENAHKARVLLDRMIQALGGQAYMDIQDISQEGRTYSFYHGRPNSMGILYWRFYKYPDKDRIELTKQRDVVYLYNADKAYEITYKGTRAQDDKDLQDYLRRRQFTLDWVLRHWLNEPGVALFYDGTAVAGDKPADEVMILNSRNQGVTIDIDVDTHLPIKRSFSWRDPADKERNVEEELYDAYRPVQGIMTPFSLTRFFNGDMSNQRFLTSVTYNKGISDSLFQAQITYNVNQPAPRK